MKTERFGSGKLSLELVECMRQIFESEAGAELIGASRLARALSGRDRDEFDHLVASYTAASRPAPRRRRRSPH